MNSKACNLWTQSNKWTSSLIDSIIFSSQQALVPQYTQQHLPSNSASIMNVANEKTHQHFYQSLLILLDNTIIKRVCLHHDNKYITKYILKIICAKHEYISKSLVSRVQNSKRDDDSNLIANDGFNCQQSNTMLCQIAIILKCTIQLANQHLHQGNNCQH